MTTAIAKQTPTLRDLMYASKSKLGEVCARHLTPDRLVRLAVAAIGRTPKLQECSPESLLAAVFVAGRLGLEPDGVLGGAHLVPFGRECQLIIGYRGLVDLAIRSGKVRAVVSRVVHEKDRFKIVLGVNDSLKHVPTDEEDPGAWTHVYAVATLVDGSKQFEVMSRRQVMSIREKSRAKNNGPWANPDSEDGKEMARKTVIKRLAKSLPLSTEFASALALDNTADTGVGVSVTQVADEIFTDDEKRRIGLGPLIEGSATPSLADALQPETPSAAKKTVDELKAEEKAKSAAAKAQK